MRQQLVHHLSSTWLYNKLQMLAAGSPPHALISISLPLPDNDTDWLAYLPDNAAYWYRARPDQGEFLLGLGHALHISSHGPGRFGALDNALLGLQQHWQSSGVAAKLFAGFAFSPQNLSPLPNAILAVPALTLSNDKNTCTAIVTMPAGAIDAHFRALTGLLGKLAPAPANNLRPMHPPIADEIWLGRVSTVLRKINQGDFQKLVLSRVREIRTEAASHQPAWVASVLERLCHQQAESVIYAHGQGEHVFLGASPERLVSLEAGMLMADALAGTSWDQASVLDIYKNRHEQAMVVEAIVQNLTPFCQGAPAIEALTEHTLANLRHLRNRISGQARNGTRLFELIDALHPTPAVGGHPSGPALACLDRLGEQRHGWYAGGFALMDQHGNGDCSVALRSALISGKQLILQAGAGIVTGSNPQHELAETEAKLKTMIDALTLRPGKQHRRA